MRESSLYQKTTTELKKLADPDQANDDGYYHKTQGYKSYGIKMPRVRGVAGY